MKIHKSCPGVPNESKLAGRGKVCALWFGDWENVSMMDVVGFATCVVVISQTSDEMYDVLGIIFEFVRVSTEMEICASVM
jgi:hypothetical protein